MGLKSRYLGRRNGSAVSSDHVRAPARSAGWPGEAERQARAYALGKTVDYRLVHEIQQYLHDESVAVRRAAISSLEQQWPTGDSLGLIALTTSLTDADPQVRSVAATAIGEFIPCVKSPFADQRHRRGQPPNGRQSCH